MDTLTVGSVVILNIKAWKGKVGFIINHQYLDFYVGRDYEYEVRVPNEPYSIPCNIEDLIEVNLTI